MSTETINPEQLINSISSLQDEVNKAKQEMIKRVEYTLKPALAYIFNLDPRLKTLSWTQYTPYFNDGDTCEFSRYDIYFNDSDGDDEDHPDVYHNGNYRKMVYRKNSENRYVNIENPDFDQLAHDVVELSEKLVSSIDDDIWYELYGDHVKVLITCDNGQVKIETKDYKHD